VLTQHVMEAVSREMFGGAQGRTMVERTLPRSRLESMPADQKRPADRVLGSLQKYRPSGGGRAGHAGPRGLTCLPVKEEAMTAGDRVAYNGYTHLVSPGWASMVLLSRWRTRHRDAARARSRRAVEPPAQRADENLEGDSAARKVAQRRAHFADDPPRLVRLRDDRLKRSRIHGSILGFLGISVACS